MAANQGDQCGVCMKSREQAILVEANGRLFCLEHVPDVPRPDHVPETTRCMECAHPTAEWIAPQTYECQRDGCPGLMNFSSDSDLAAYVQDVDHAEEAPETCPDCDEHYLYREEVDDEEWYYVHEHDPATEQNSSPGMRMSFDSGCRVSGD